MDGEREIVITHRGNEVQGDYVKERECDPQDGTEVLRTNLDFKATLTGYQLKGKTNTCKYGSRNSSENGFVLEDLELTVSEDGNTLEGKWFSSTFNEWRPVTITRKCPHNIEDRLKAADRQGPQQLLSLSYQLWEQDGVNEECLHPYAAKADCFGPGARMLTLEQATGPGAIGFPQVLLGKMLGWTGPESVPRVQTFTQKFSEPMLITKDTCNRLLHDLEKAFELMDASALYYNEKGNQKQVIDCVKKLAEKHGWRTFWP